MKKFYKIFLLLIVLIFLTTYSPKESDFISEKNVTLFKIKRLEIINNFIIETNEIEKKLSKIYNKSIFLIKKKDIADPLNKINFLEKVEVRKKYPNTIILRVYETEPVAILFKNKVKYILDSSSNLISFDDSTSFDHLPIVFGEGAENNFNDFLGHLKNNDFPNKTIKNFYYFQIGRWDLQLKNNKIIKFPHKNIDEVIKKTVELLNRKDFENYNIIDLRVDGKIIVE